MNWVQENKSLAGILGVMIAGILGLGAWLYLSYADYAASMEKWGQNDTSISSLKSKKVYPNKENADSRETEVTAYADKVDLLRSALLSDKVQQPIKPMSQTEFQAKLKERATAIVQLAKTAEVTLPADFALGFSDYTNNVPRSADVAAELGVHLDVMERLVTTVIESGVKSVDFFERDKLPNEDKPVEVKKPAPEKKPSKSKGKKNAKRAPITEEEAAEPVLDRYRVKMIVTSDQAPFQSIINTLCDPVKMPHFLVVRLVRVENERQDGPSRDEIARKKNPEVVLDQPAPDPGAAPGGKVADAPKVAPDAVTIMGEEKLKVYLEVDYVRFRAPATEENPQNPASSTAAVTKS